LRRFAADPILVQALKGMRTLVIAVGMWIAVSTQTGGAPRLHFRDIAQPAGLTSIPHFSAEKRYLIETVGGGVGLLDCDNDGKPDIVVVGDSTIDRYLKGGDLLVTLYRQDGDRIPIGSGVRSSWRHSEESGEWKVISQWRRGIIDRFETT
jgi:hypothetical protein